MIYVICFVCGVLLGIWIRETFICLHGEWETIDEKDVVSHEDDKIPIGRNYYQRCKKCGTVRIKKLRS